MDHKQKGRNLSPLEYVKVLEVEWWICNLRRKIYPGIKDKNRFGTSSQLKKERIIEISERNEIPHIFGDKSMMKELNKQFSPSGGFPNFEGSNDDDLIYYYYPTTEVRCFYGLDDEGKPKIKIGKIKDFRIKDKKVKIIFNAEETELLPISSVTRIF